MRLCFDIETDGIEATKVHCIVVKHLDDGHSLRFGPNDIGDAVAYLGRAKELVGHNIVGYDLPVLGRLHGLRARGKIRDTAVLARLYLPDPVLKAKDFSVNGKNVAFPKQLYGNHSLEAWGHRIGVLKDTWNKGVNDWSVFTEEMMGRCASDVEVSAALYSFLMSKGMPEESIELEHKFAAVLAQVQRTGFTFDMKAAEKLQQVLVKRRAELTEEAKKVFSGWTVSYTTPKKNIQRTRFIDFNPTSRQHIARLLSERHGWKPVDFTPDGRPKVDEKVLGKLPWPEAKLFSDLLLVQKRLGYLCEGSHSLFHYFDKRDSRIHGRIIHQGTATSRCSHSSPNLSQVPRVGNPYGEEFRSLFTVPAGSVLVGVDASGLELRMLASRMAAYDGGAYAKLILESDIHVVNQTAAGLATRDQAKTFIYAWLYGAAAEKLGTIVGGGEKEGRALSRRFLKALPAIKRVREDCIAGKYVGLDGRKTKADVSEHAALNYRLQEDGAVSMKLATVLFAESAPEEARIVMMSHDEIQIEVSRKELSDEVGNAATSAIRSAGQRFGLACPLDGTWRTGRAWSDTH